MKAIEEKLLALKLEGEREKEKEKSSQLYSITQAYEPNIVVHKAESDKYN